MKPGSLVKIGPWYESWCEQEKLAKCSIVMWSRSSARAGSRYRIGSLDSKEVAIIVQVLDDPMQGPYEHAVLIMCQDRLGWVLKEDIALLAPL